MPAPIGTLIAEINLDTSKAEKGQQRLLKEATSTTLSIEKNFQNLGIKTSETYDLMRQKIENSYVRIANSAKVTTDDIIRAEKARAEKLAQINDQQYGHQTGVIDKLKGHWIAATVAIGAAWMAVSEAMEYMDQGAKAMQVESSFKIMADAAGVNSGKMIASMKAATKETIDDSDLMQKANKLMLAGYDPTQIEQFSKAAITASRYMGVSVSEGFDALGDAIANKTPKALNKLGAVTREQMKVVQDAITNGADSVVIFELAMANLELKEAKLKGTQDAATLSVQQFYAQVNEAKEAVGKFIIGGLQKYWGIMQELGAGFLYDAAAVNWFVASLARMAAWTAEKAGFKDLAASTREYANFATETGNNLFKHSEELSKKGMANITGEVEAGAKAANQEIENDQKAVNAIMKKLGAYAGVKKAAEEMAKLKEQWEDTSRTLNAKIAGGGLDGGLDDLRKALIQNQLEADNLKDKFKKLPTDLRIKAYSMIDQSKEVADRNAREKDAQGEFDDFEKLQKEAEQRAKDRLAAERDIYKDLRGYAGDYYEATNRMIESQAETYRKMGIDEVAVAKWVAEELRKAEIVKLKASDKFFDGYKAGLMEMQNDAMTWGKAGYEIFKEFSTQSRNVLSDVLFDGAKGKFKSFKDYMSSFSDAMLKKWTDVIAQMVVEWALGIDKMKGGEAGGGGLSSLSGLIGMGASLVGNWIGGFSNGSMYDNGNWGTEAGEFNGGGLGFGSANGNAFMNGQVLAFANGAAFTNGIYDRPTLLPMARGAGLIGEAGPEAVMPLKRTASGKLGIEGGGSTINVPITVNGTSSKRMIADLQTDIEAAVQKVIRRHS